MEPMTTIFAVVNKGLVCRNILRMGPLARLLDRPDARVVLFVPDRAIPDLRADFPDPRVVFEPLPPIGYSKLRRKLFVPLVRNSLFNRTRRIHMRYGTGKATAMPPWLYALTFAFYFPLSHVLFIRPALQWLELRLFADRVFAPYFDRYRPEVAVQLSIFSKEDIMLVKEAKRRRVPTVAMPKGWDTLDKLTMQVHPDRLVAQNEPMREQAIRNHRYAPEDITLAGFPVFDAYLRPENAWTRERTCAALGVDPAKPYIVYGAEGPWSAGDPALVERLAQWVREASLGPLSLVVRPYFIDVDKKLYESVRGVPGVVIDDQHRLRDYFQDRWDPSPEEVVRFMNVVRHAAAVLCVRSTLSLDAAVLDRPCINILYGVTVDKKGRDVTRWIYGVDFYQDVLKSGGVRMAHSDEELKREIADAIAHPAADAAGRARLRERMCGPLDGRSAERVAAAILAMARPGAPA